MPTRAVENSNDDKLIWGAKAIGERLGLDPRQTFYQLEAGRIEGARKWGRKWSAPDRMLPTQFEGESGILPCQATG